jgi:NAD-dependent SIR2 family protein deacetylase
MEEVDTSIVFLTQVFKNPTKCAAHASLMADLAKAAACARPTAFHTLLRVLSCHGILGRTYTQNIDDLELKAGLTTVGEEPNCVQLHGSVMKVQCTQCGFTEHTVYHFPALSSGKIPPCPQCEMQIERRKSEGRRIGSKGGLLRPAIILYGESHPKSDDIESMRNLDRSKADNLLVVGTSLKTHGSVSLIKELARVIRKRGGGAYYLDLASPPAKEVKVLDHVLQADCQDFAKHALDQLETSKFTGFPSVDGDTEKAGFADLVETGRVRKDMRPSWDWA